MSNNIFNLPCVYCSNQLSECGSLLNSPTFGPMVACEICRGLYYVEVIVQAENKPLIAINPTNLPEEVAYDIIRWAESRVPLSEYLTPVEDKKEVDLKSYIASANTPNDLIRRLRGN